MAKQQKVEFFTGNDAAAYAVKLCKPEVIPAYPITPQSPITEKLSEYVADGEIDAEYVEVEGEHSCLAVARGVGLMGARVFTATCGPGLQYAHENMQMVSSDRTPLVMAVPNRSVLSLFPDLTDSMPEAASGIIQLFCETPQEVLDTMIQAYKICEDHRVLLPAFVLFDGYVTSHTGSTIYLPDQEDVDNFLPKYEPYFGKIDPKSTMTRAYAPVPVMFSDFDLAMENAKGIIKEANEEYFKAFGRKYGNGLFDKISLDDAQVALVTHSSMTGTAREVVKNLRAQGKKIGLLRIKSYRPFPSAEIADALKNVKAVAVCERHNTPGLGEGEICGDVKSALYDHLSSKPLVIDAALGLGGSDITVPELTYIANVALEAAATGVVKKRLIWSTEIPR